MYIEISARIDDTPCIVPSRNFQCWTLMQRVHIFVKDYNCNIRLLDFRLNVIFEYASFDVCERSRNVFASNQFMETDDRSTLQSVRDVF